MISDRQVLSSKTHPTNLSKETTTIRRPFRAQPAKKTGPDANDDIQATEVQLITSQGEHLGPTPTARAREMAAEEGLDLVLISPNAKPPVAKILDLGKLKYEQQKKLNQPVGTLGCKAKLPILHQGRNP